MNKFKNMLKNEDGQGMVEYGLLIGLIAIVVIAAIFILGPKIAAMFTDAGNALDNPGGAVAT